MNIEKIKEFIALRSELYASGVIGLNLYEDAVHVDSSKLVGAADLQIASRGWEKYPYEVSINQDGIKIFAILTKTQLEELYPQFAGFMVEDVLLDGGEEHATA